MRSAFAFCLALGLLHGAVHAQPGAAPASSPSAQPTNTTSPVDLKALPEEIKSLNWKSVNFTALAPLDRVRALMLMNDVFDEISAQLTAEADLQSAFIENTDQGAKFVAFQPIVEPAPLTLPQAKQIAAAMLQAGGPMASSPYATRLGDSPKDVLSAYEQMYTSTVNRKWAAISDARLRVRAMSQFLVSTKQTDAYQAFVPGEIKLLAEQQQAVQAQQAATLAEKQAQQQEKQAAARERQAEQSKQQADQQAQATKKMQQAMMAAQSQQQPPMTKGDQAQLLANENANAEAGGGVTYPYYGYPYAYYGGGWAWNTGHNNWWWNHHGYLGGAQARTDARFNGWHGGGGFRR